MRGGASRSEGSLRTRGPGGVSIPPTLSLLHLANFNSTNVGSGALILGEQRVLREDVALDLEFVPEPWDGYSFGSKKFDERFVARVNAESDGLLVGAAISLYSRPYLSHAGMGFNLPSRFWNRIEKPVMFYGLSHRAWPHQPYLHVDKLREAMGHILSNDRILFSVRNDGTKAWLESLLGIVSDKIEAIPDPALYVTPEDVPHPEIREGKTNIVLSLNNEDEAFRYGGRLREWTWRVWGRYVDEKRLLRWFGHAPGWRRERSAALGRLARAIERIAARWDVNLIVCPHHLDDHTMIGEFASLLSPKMAHFQTVTTGIRRVSQARAFYDLYAKADLVIAMRVHSMSPALGLGTPMIALSTQSRISHFMRDVGMADYLVDFFDPNLTEILAAKVASILEGPDMTRDAFRRACGLLRERSRAYHRKIAGLLGAAAPEREAGTGRLRVA